MVEQQRSEPKVEHEVVPLHAVIRSKAEHHELRKRAKTHNAV